MTLKIKRELKSVVCLLPCPAVHVTSVSMLMLVPHLCPLVTLFPLSYWHFFHRISIFLVISCVIISWFLVQCAGFSWSYFPSHCTLCCKPSLVPFPGNWGLDKIVHSEVFPKKPYNAQEEWLLVSASANLLDLHLVFILQHLRCTTLPEFTPLLQYMYFIHLFIYYIWGV